MAFHIDFKCQYFFEKKLQKQTAGLWGQRFVIFLILPNKARTHNSKLILLFIINKLIDSNLCFMILCKYNLK